MSCRCMHQHDVKESFLFTGEDLPVANLMLSGSEKAGRGRFSGFRDPVLDIPVGLNVTQRTNLAMTPIGCNWDKQEQ